MRFNQDELFDEIAPAGTYLARITAAREATSRHGNPMVTVWLRLVDKRGAGRSVADYFVTAGVRPSALAVARRRLLALCRACGLDPQPDVELDLEQLLDRGVQVDVDVTPGERGPRNVALRYRPAPPA